MFSKKLSMWVHTQKKITKNKINKFHLFIFLVQEDSCKCSEEWSKKIQLKRKSGMEKVYCAVQFVIAICVCVWGVRRGVIACCSSLPSKEYSWLLHMYYEARSNCCHIAVRVFVIAMCYRFIHCRLFVLLFCSCWI